MPGNEVLVTSVIARDAPPCVDSHAFYFFGRWFVMEAFLPQKIWREGKIIDRAVRTIVFPPLPLNFLVDPILNKLWTESGALSIQRPGSKRCLARSDSRQPLPGLRRNA